MSDPRYKAGGEDPRPFIPERKLWLRVIQNAMDDWRDLDKEFSDTIHKELLVFFFEDPLEDIINANGLDERLIEAIRQQAREIGLACDIPLLNREKIKSKHCIICEEKRNKNDFHGYRLGRSKGKKGRWVYTEICNVCKANREGYGLLELKQRKVIEKTLELRSLPKAAQQIGITEATLINWLYKENHKERFIKILSEYGIKPTDLLTFKKHKAKNRKCRNVSTGGIDVI